MDGLRGHPSITFEFTTRFENDQSGLLLGLSEENRMTRTINMRMRIECESRSRFSHKKS